MQLMTAGEVAVQFSASHSTESSHCAGGAVPCHLWSAYRSMRGLVPTAATS